MDSLFTGYQIRYIFSKFNPLNTGTPLIRTLCMAPSVFVSNGLYILIRVTDRGKGCKTDTRTSMKGFRKQLAATVTTGSVASHLPLFMLRFKPQDHKVAKTEATHIHNTCMIKYTNGTTVHREVPKGMSPESSDKISQSSANPRSSDSSKVTTLRTPSHP